MYPPHNIIRSSNLQTKFRAGRLFFLLCILLCVQCTFADGVHFPEIAYKKAPEMPGQTAVLVYKDGIEKLIVQAELKAEGKEFGWVIPLPAKPTEFEKFSPGLLKTLSLNIQPNLIHDPSPFASLLLLLAIPATFWFFWILMFRPRHLTAKLLFLIFMWVLFSSMMMSAGVVRLKKSLGAEPVVIDRQEVGSYTLAVLEAKDSSSLNSWLSENGFVGLNEQEEKIVSDYISRGWCFVTAKLKRDGAGYSKPHPLMMSFPADKPVYPMRLTSAVGHPLYLELYVVADKAAVCEPLKYEVYNKFCYDERAFSNRWTNSKKAGFTGQFYQKIGHPDSMQLFWDGCMISRLTGELSTEQMGKDFYISFTDAGPGRKIYFTKKGAISTGWLVFLASWTVSILILVASRRKKIYEKGGRLHVLKNIGVPALLLSAALGLLSYAAIPETEAHSLGRTSFLNIAASFDIEYQLLEYGEMVFGEEGLNKTDSELEKIITDSEMFRDGRNIFTGEDLLLEDSPGNFTIGRDENGIFMRGYNFNGFPIEFREQEYKDWIKDR